jgi:hypothetical protein
MSDDTSRRLDALLDRLAAVLAEAEAQLAAALVAENLRFIEIERRLSALERGECDDDRRPAAPRPG